MTDARMLPLPDRLAGAVWGHLVGDAVGVPYEFRPASALGDVRFGATGTHDRPPGTWSDDGSLMLALLDSLLSNGSDTADQARRAVEWYRHGAYTPDGVVFDVGRATREAIRAIERGVPAEEAGPTHERASGNGSLMRILPLALVMRDATDSELVALAHRASRVTHGTAPAQVACALYVLVARRLLARDRVGRAAALERARATLREVYERAGDSAEHLAALDQLEAWTDRSGRGFVTDSFWSAWDAFAGAGSYRETIERAVAYGNDTDTTAAIAGGLAGIRWGIDGIPADWLAGMRGHDLADELVDRLIAGAGYRTSGLYPLRVDWVPLDSVPSLAVGGGRLGMTFLPGKRREGIAGSHWRDVAVDTERLRAHHGADDLLLLVEDHELEAARVPDIAAVMEAAGIAVHRHPIRDMDVPADPEAFRATLADVRALLDAGRSVVVACAGGLGRTGTVVACLLRDAGLSAEAAIELTRATRHGAIENEAQERFVGDGGPTAAHERGGPTR